MDSIRIPLVNAQQAATALQGVYQTVKPYLIAEHRLILTVTPETRSLAQNARLWAMLTDISKQVDWYGQKLTPEEWKDVFTASLKKQKAVPGIDGGFVILGQRTSKMSKKDMTELQELMEAFGADRGVRFTAPEGMYA